MELARYQGLHGRRRPESRSDGAKPSDQHSSTKKTRANHHFRHGRYLIGNNDAHGKNFSLVYPNKEIRLAPLYDAISTIYYSELNTDMAMRIGREYSSEKVTPKDFEQLAGDAGLAKPLVRRRVPELAAAGIETLDKMKITDKVSVDIAGLIRKRCTRVREEFRT
jgi:serine/threonine-protein kinase HipA